MDAWSTVLKKSCKPTMPLYCGGFAQKKFWINVRLLYVRKTYKNVMCGISPQFQTWRQEIGRLDKKIAQRGNVTLLFFALKGMIHEKMVMDKLLFGPFHG
jgi:hypothetical protein